MIIPLEQLDQDVLEAIIEQFVLREGTDYGRVEYSLSEKVSHVKRQLEREEVYIVYSELHETVDIIPRSKLDNSAD